MPKFRVIESLSSSASDEFAPWEITDEGEMRWSQEAHNLLDSRHLGISILIDVDEDTGAFEIRGFRVRGKLFTEPTRG